MGKLKYVPLPWHMNNYKQAFQIGFVYLLQIEYQSTVRKKMATGTFAYNALRTKTLKDRIKHKEKS